LGTVLSGERDVWRAAYAGVSAGMLQRNWGRVIFMSSESGVQIPEEMIHYGMTKAAELALVNGIAQLSKRTGVTVNAVLPGPTASEGVTDFVDKLARARNKRRPNSRRNFSAMYVRRHCFNGSLQWMKLPTWSPTYARRSPAPRTGGGARGWRSAARTA